MYEPNFETFYNKEGLILISQLEKSIDLIKIGDFSWVKAQKNIEAIGLDPDDFYYESRNTEHPYCYYKGFVLIEILSLNNDLLFLKESIQMLEKKIHEAVASRDFDLFFSLIDKRIATDLYIEIFDFIPDEEKYLLYYKLLKTSEKVEANFPIEFRKKVQQYEGVTSSIPIIDENGYVKVFRGQLKQTASAKKPTPVEIASSWTTDINIAIKYALKDELESQVYKGKVHKDNINEYLTKNKEKEVIARSGTVEEIKIVELIKLQEIAQYLNYDKVLGLYKKYAEKIKVSWFFHPEGIHAVSHTKRVLFFNLMLCDLEQVLENEYDLLAKAALYHDIGRTNDGYDPNHGYYSYKKAITENFLIESNGANQAETDEVKIIRFILEMHPLPDRSAYKALKKYKINNQESAIRCLHIFKDGDALDRVRINDLNPDYLRTKSAYKLLMFAYQLYKQGEY